MGLFPAPLLFQLLLSFRACFVPPFFFAIATCLFNVFALFPFLLAIATCLFNVLALFTFFLRHSPLQFVYSNFTGFDLRPCLLPPRVKPLPLVCSKSPCLWMSMNTWTDPPTKRLVAAICALSMSDSDDASDGVFGGVCRGSALSLPWSASGVPAARVS